MNTGKTVFAQVMDFLPLYDFHKCVERYHGHYKVQSFSCLDQFLSMAFAQLTYRESLRDIEACLSAAKPKLYHMGFRSSVARNTLANANAGRDWRIWQDFALTLIAEARALYAHEDFGVELSQTAYALDSTTIDLCLNLFPWAKFRKHKAAVKMHTLLDLRGNIPTIIWITSGKVHDVNVLDHLFIEPGAIYIMDRGGATWIIHACIRFSRPRHPSSPGPKRDSISSGFTRPQWTRRAGCCSTRPWC